MVEVFKTNVTSNHQAKKLAIVIEDSLGLKATFDLADCDRILRVETHDGIEPFSVINLLKDMGASAEVLQDYVETMDFLLIDPIKSEHVTSALNCRRLL